VSGIGAFGKLRFVFHAHMSLCQDGRVRRLAVVLVFHLNCYGLVFSFQVYSFPTPCSFSHQNKQNSEVVITRFCRVGARYKLAQNPDRATRPLFDLSRTLQPLSNMDTIEDVFTPIRSVFQAHPVYTVVGISLGFSIYRWNANRVSGMTQISVPSACHAEERP